MDRLVAGAESLGLALDARQREQFVRYHEALVSWNRRANLTSVTAWEQVRVVHFLDSLSAATALSPEVRGWGRVLDVGTGAGFPGVPLKIAFPGLQVDVLEATGKKVAFLEHLVSLLGLTGIRVHAGRAETLAHETDLREQYDAVIARGVSRMAVLAELTLPFVRVGGIQVALKKGDIEAEVADAAGAVRILGGGMPQIEPVAVPDLADGRVLIVLPKVAPTPPQYPRRPGIPTKRPLAQQHNGRTDQPEERGGDLSPIASQQA